jgi:hypothetical protein
VRDSANISLTSSWGYAENITLKKKSMLWNNPRVEWIELPDSSVGMGNLSIYHENDQLSVRNVTWNRPCSPVGAPISIRLVHDWFSYFIGKTRLILEFFSNGSVSIDHIVMSSKWPEHLPYNQSFSFTSNFPLSVWFEFVDYLEDNQSYSWQSWVYDSPEGGWVDQWGFLSTLTIEWNATTQKVITEMVDNDSGSGDRIYVTPTTSAFIKRLLNISDDIIAKTILVEAETTETTESTPLSPKIVVFSAFFVLVLFRKKRKFFGGAFR